MCTRVLCKGKQKFNKIHESDKEIRKMRSEDMATERELEKRLEELIFDIKRRHITRILVFC